MSAPAESEPVLSVEEARAQVDILLGKLLADAVRGRSVEDAEALGRLGGELARALDLLEDCAGVAGGVFALKEWEARRRALLGGVS